MDKKKINESIVELNMLDQKLRQMEEQAKMIEQQIFDTQITEMSLEEIKSKKNSEVLLPIGGGIFMPGKIESTDKVIVHLGSKILAKKKIEDAKKIIRGQRDKLMIDGEKMSMQMQETLMKMTELEGKIRFQNDKHEHSCDDPECEHEH